MIRTEPLQTQPRWTSLSGTILEGGYELQDLLEAGDTDARFKVRVLGDRELDSVAAIFPLPDGDIDRQVELWRNVKMLRHPNLSGPLGAGRLQLDGVPAAYVVVRRADETLHTVLTERALTAEEAGETLMSAARALEALHLNGLVHGCVAPELVLAVGDSIQLPAECARTAGILPVVETTRAKYLAPESPNANLTPEADLWCLGATLFEAFTQKVWTENARGEIRALPEPFAAIIARCLETDPEARCGLAEAVALYRGELKLPPAARRAAEPSIIVPEKEVVPASAAPLVEQHEPAPADVAAPMKPAAKEQPAAKVFIENRPEAAIEASEALVPAAPEVAAAPSSADAASTLTAQIPDTDEGSPRLPQAAAITALAPKGEAQAAGRQSNVNAVADVPTTYTPQPKPPIAAEQNWGKTRRRPALDDEAEGGTKKMWIWAGLALLLVIALIWSLRPKHQAPATPSASTIPTSAPAAGQNGGAWQTRTLEPNTAASQDNLSHPGGAAGHANTVAKPAISSKAADVAKPSLHSQALKQTPKQEGSGVKGSVWRVVLYTYNRLPDAEKKARAINARRGSLHAEVFSPLGNGGPYLVTTAGRMSRDEAAQARHRAIAAGMARDAYIQNYTK